MAKLRQRIAAYEREAEEAAREADRQRREVVVSRASFVRPLHLTAPRASDPLRELWRKPLDPAEVRGFRPVSVQGEAEADPWANRTMWRFFEGPGASAYAAYMRSFAWKEKRRDKLELVDRCELCGSGDGLEVHHLSYEHVFAEPMDDLQVLCRECHAKVPTPAR